jgi:hypothetical protein
MGRQLRDHCQAGQDNEFGFVRFFERAASGKFQSQEPETMFVFNRSALAVLVPLALLLAAVLFSGGSAAPASQAQSASATQQDHTVAANLPSR